ncbi:hypothetical protein Rsub_00517 [Raphidocelis subcapitata]|uniref:Uncharacterized protein n=1 Tax=Raphidocelis subcapitata TaxID=307507 RepID=A0A2V0NKG8_9CHLO|nr:hypothetical protein Rsub_00517 [Raphidocelis subcapitata]|eukprot:GBF87806.1 hypothetical protein Rsub_00517 [Raphidocelis subcapitata]
MLGSCLSAQRAAAAFRAAPAARGSRAVAAAARAAPLLGRRRAPRAAAAGFGGAAADGGEIGPGSVKQFSAYTSVEEWKKLDSKVNTYPCTRSFQAIGLADPSFQPAIVAAVASVVGTIHVECVSARPSSGGKYTAVRVGPVHVASADQVVEIFARIKEAGGDRLKWYM